MITNSTGKTELLAYNKVKRKFFSLMEIESQDPDDIEIYEFEGQNFNLVVK
jgi:hypothetical protein